MKIGEVYKNKHNHYISQITEITPTHVILTNKQGVIDTVKIEHFRNNWIIYNSILSYKDLISKAFKNWTILTSSDGITVADGSYYIKFTAVNDNLVLEFSDDIMNIVGLEKETQFNLSSIERVVDLIASLILD